MATTRHANCTPSETFSLERVRYFPRMLLTPDDLIAEQEHFRSKFRRYLRLLHGWGVVCGAEIFPAESEYSVNSSPGYILGPYGNEIVVWKEILYDIRTDLECGCPAVSATGGDAADPWCSDVIRRMSPNQTYYIAIRHQEMETRAVHSQPQNGDCGPRHCEPSRLLDCFVVKTLTELPAAPPQTSHPDCPPCPDEPWVVLAAITLDADGRVLPIENHPARKSVSNIADPLRAVFMQPGTIPANSTLPIDFDYLANDVHKLRMVDVVPDNDGVPLSWTYQHHKVQDRLFHYQFQLTNHSPNAIASYTIRIMEL